MSKFDEMHAAIMDAESTLRAAGDLSTKMAAVLAGRLRMVKSEWALAKMKKELRDFNMTTMRWRDE